MRPWFCFPEVFADECHSVNYWEEIVPNTHILHHLFCNFQTQLVSVDSLCRVIDPRQLTPDLSGTLTYDHDEWIELRLAFEEFIWDALDALEKLYAIEGELGLDEYASTQEDAKVCDV